MEIVCDPNDRNCFIVMRDGEEWKQIARAIFGKRPKFPKGETFEAWEERCVRLYALRRLSAREYAGPQLEQLLKRHRVSETVIGKVVGELRGQGYIDDNEWLKRYVKGQLRRGKGPNAIRMQCLKKGFRTDEIEPYLEVDAEDQKERIAALLEAKYSLEDFKEKQKAIAGCIRRGFSMELVMQVVDAKCLKFRG